MLRAGREGRAEGGRGGGGGLEEETEAGAELAMLLVEAKMAAAEYAFERDQARQKAKQLRAELARVAGGGKKVAQQMTSIEVR